MQISFRERERESDCVSRWWWYLSVGLYIWDTVRAHRREREKERKKEREREREREREGERKKERVGYCPL